MSGSIEGEVLNLQDGQPLAGAELALAGAQSQTASSDAKGLFSFADLEAGSYELTASKTGFDDGVYGPLVVLDDNPTRIKIALEPKA